MTNLIIINVSYSLIVHLSLFCKDAAINFLLTAKMIVTILMHRKLIVKLK